MLQFSVKTLVIATGCSIALTTTAVGQSSAHPTSIVTAYVDKKSEVVETQDSVTAKFWSVADGSLLAAVSMKSPEYASKRLRLMKSMKNPKWDAIDATQRTFKNDYTSTSTSYTYGARTDGVLTTSVTFPSGKMRSGAIDRHQNNGKILAFFAENEQTKLYLIDEKDANDASGNWKGALLATYPSKNLAAPKFSDSGDWVVDRYTGIVVNAKTGKWVPIPPEAISPLLSWPVTYSADDMTAIFGSANGIIAVDMATGKQVAAYMAPAEIRQEKGYYAYPCRDGKSFVYAGSWWESENRTKRAWLVKEGKATELVD